MQQVRFEDLIPGRNYIIQHIAGMLRSRTGNFIRGSLRGQIDFNNIIYDDGTRLDPRIIGTFITNQWIYFENERNTALRKKNILKRPRTVNGLSIKEELLQRGPWHPNRIDRARTMGYRNENDPEGNWEPTVVGHGTGPKSRRSRSRKNRKSRKSRR
jgi:hypothetical protein